MARKKITDISSSFDGADVNFLGSREEPAEERTVESRDKLRSSLQKQITDFINQGGEITEISSAYSRKKTDKPAASA